MKSKIVPIDPGHQKYEVFNVFVGEIDKENEFVGEAKVGVAFLKGKSRVFSLRLWMFDANKYFVSPNDDDQTKYDILAVEEYATRDGEEKSQWHKVGQGQYFGAYLQLKFHLLNRTLFLSLFPNGKDCIETVA